MSNTIEKTKEEAAPMFAKYWGQMISFKDIDGNVYSDRIKGWVLITLENNKIQSFQVLLRSIDEMTEEEFNRLWAIENPLLKTEYALWRNIVITPIKKNFGSYSFSLNAQWEGNPKKSISSTLVTFSAAGWDYLRSIGIATNEEDRKLITIKN